MISNNNSQYYKKFKVFKYIDWPLLLLIMLMSGCGLIILYSAASQSNAVLLKQLVRLLSAFVFMCILAFIPPHKYKSWTPSLYVVGLVLLVAVMVIGKIGKGAQRWLDLGFFRFQPSEIMKLAVPMMLAWYIDKKKIPMSFSTIVVATILMALPFALIAKQPDLGTAIMVAIAGGSVLFAAGLAWQFFAYGSLAIAISAPFLWTHLHDYQKKRLITLIDPEQDPLGSGYHIIQSKIAIGSGGTFGKGWLNGTQAHLNFLPEHATDFIFAVCGEEFGLFGGTIIIILLTLISLRGLTLAKSAHSTYTRLLATSLISTFFLSGFVNIAMVMGILPVVGIPLPLVSYGGTAMLTFFAFFGVIMSIGTHKVMFDEELR
ncbi:MAG TPA: rod shape-determining protein RodA [Legionellales bacterium]|jgi:rod shape determining protein RodA|nr:rod shape-determining protein RodA [Legionellales bacterium]